MEVTQQFWLSSSLYGQDRASLKMELTLRTTTTMTFASSCPLARNSKLIDHIAVRRNSPSPFYLKPKELRARVRVISSGLLETAASVAVAAVVVGAAATLLVKRTKASEATEVPMKICEACNGSGICPECRGEGFVLKKMSDESAERARLTAKNMATRYTAGLPKKWSYCTQCSSARSCRSCGGSGKLSY